MSKRDQIQEEALNIALMNRRCTLAISMGVGKTYIGLQYIQHFMNILGPIRVLVAAPKVSIFQSWLDDAVKFKLDLGVLHSIKFTTYLSLPKQTQDYDIVILDEVHSLRESHDEWLSQFEGRILGLTGTPPRHQDSEKGKMVSKYCPVMHKYITNSAVEDGILNDYRIHVHYLNLNTSNTVPIETKKMKFFTSERKNYDYWTERVEAAQGQKQKQIASVMRMRALMGFATKEQYAARLMNHVTGKTIVFCNTHEQADKLCKDSYHSGNVHSNENLRRFKEDEINQLSCVAQLNEGVTIPDLRVGIILHAFGNERKSNQRIGRLLRLNPNDTADIHVLCYRNTVDEKWVDSALQDLDPEKITYYNASQHEHAVF